MRAILEVLGAALVEVVVASLGGLGSSESVGRRDGHGVLVPLTKVGVAVESQIVRLEHVERESSNLVLVDGLTLELSRALSDAAVVAVRKSQRGSQEECERSLHRRKKMLDVLV